MRKLIFMFILLSCVGSVTAQRKTFFSKSEIGVNVGQMYYLGDLNKFKPFYQSNWSGGLMYRYNLQPRVTLRFNYLYGKVEAYDKESSNALFVNRNLEFRSVIHEVAGGVEFHYVPFTFGKGNKNAGTVYLLGQLGMFHMNPKAMYNDQLVALQPMSTEGQGTSIGTRKPYHLYQVCMPLGMGAKFSIGNKITVNFDLAIRKTFTDYLDDVGSATYANSKVIGKEISNTAANLSNRSLDGSKYGVRGNPSTKDWYVYSGVTFAFRLGREKTCFY
jgi:hypothetical protein